MEFSFKTTKGSCNCFNVMFQQKRIVTLKIEVSYHLFYVAMLKENENVVTLYVEKEIYVEG